LGLGVCYGGNVNTTHTHKTHNTITAGTHTNLFELASVVVCANDGCGNPRVGEGESGVGTGEMERQCGALCAGVECVRELGGAGGLGWGAGERRGGEDALAHSTLNTHTHADDQPLTPPPH
jgi:hypothetical protein